MGSTGGSTTRTPHTPRTAYQRRLVELVEQARSTDPRTRDDAYRELLRALRPITRRIQASYRRVDEDDAASAAHETLLRVVASYNGVIPVANWWGYCYRLALGSHAHTLYYRSRLTEQPAAMLSGGGPGGDNEDRDHEGDRCDLLAVDDPALQRLQHRDDLYAALSRVWHHIHAIDRRIWIWHHIGLAYATICQLLRTRCGVTRNPKSIDNALTRIKAKLRDRLGPRNSRPRRSLVRPAEHDLTYVQQAYDLDLIDKWCDTAHIDRDLFDAVLDQLSCEKTTVDTTEMAKYLNKNVYESDGQTVRLIVRRRDGSEHVATIDADDLPAVQSKLWRVKSQRRGRIELVTGKVGEEITLGRYLLDPPEGWLVTYADRDALNCRRANLSAVESSREIDSRRPPGETGERCVYVRHDQPLRPYAVLLYSDWIGSYATLDEAVAARDKALKKI